MSRAGPALLACSCLVGACAAPDPRIATPQATVETILRATSLWGAAMPGRTSLRREPRSEAPPPDVGTLALCFVDYDRDDVASRGMADFVAGMLAAGQHRLRYTVGDNRATVLTGVREIRMKRNRRGWRVVLAESVPPEIRRGLRSSGGRLGARRDDELDL